MNYLQENRERQRDLEERDREERDWDTEREAKIREMEWLL